jgi:acylphosphatase
MSHFVRRQVSVTGRVQGVGFRYFARSAAGRIGVEGFVRNMPDGSVQAEVQGRPEEVDQFLDAVRQGPPGSRVDQVSVTELPAEEGKEGFEIRFS